MEDAKLTNLGLDDGAMIFGVFDGHGGKEVAEFVSRHFCLELLNNRAYQDRNYEQALKETFLRMDDLLRTPDGLKEVIRIAKDLPDNYPVQADPSMMMAGCTSVVALVIRNTLYVANAGDSRCILCRDGRAIELSEDHKPALPRERDRIIKAGGSVEDGRVMGNINLSRSIGDMEYKKNPSLPPEEQMITAFPDLLTHSISQRSDYLILACDGIWDILTCQECVDMVYACARQNKSLSETVETILDHCLANDVSTSGGLGCDNMTMILVKFKHQ